MTRFVFETSESEKAALAAALQSTGKTYTDWFEEQLAETLSKQHIDLSQYAVREAAHHGDLADVDAIASELETSDWAFSNADTGFLTHDIHPYPAKYIPQIPGSLIRRLTCPGELVFDPFGGSGTTATEAVRLGRRAISVDANPLATLIGRVKTAKIDDDDRLCLARLTTAIQTYALDQDSTIDEGKIKDFVPAIPNIEKWFQSDVKNELACIKRLILELTSGRAFDIASLALSRIIVRVSNQDSETRYVSRNKGIPPKFTIRTYLGNLQAIQARVEQFTALGIQEQAEFITGDSRQVMADQLAPESVSLIVTSPPYPNATDYHLYHRFRIFWLGYDPRNLGQVEIGSHLKHQRKSSGMEEYVEDMKAVLENCYQVLAAGRYAALVVGDAVFKGETIRTADRIAAISKEVGFAHISSIERPIHATRRSFSSAARRARCEHLVILRKPDRKIVFSLAPPAYKLWHYELKLRELEVGALFTARQQTSNDSDYWARVSLGSSDRWKLARLAFSSGYSTTDGFHERTWQRLLENGDGESSRRKEAKYITHGVHSYKGKFYPQLAKSLINIAGIEPGATVLDPFCGSGTVLLEGYLNGFVTLGCDMHPLAVKIGRAKTEILELPPREVDQAISILASAIKGHKGGFGQSEEQFDPNVHAEIHSWFPLPVIFKLNWLLSQVRMFGDARLVNFLEVIISDCIRSVSQQDPKDLRIRRRSQPIEDAPLIELFLQRLEVQQMRIRHFFAVASRRPFPFQRSIVNQGDCRDSGTYDRLGASAGSVDAVVTSPPYSTALPYIDTDRLSLMVLFGMSSTSRRNVEQRLTGSREIANVERGAVEQLLFSKSAARILPKSLVAELRDIHERNVKSGAGFRRLNMPALLYRYFADMQANISNVARVLRKGGKAYYVIGDSKTEVDGKWFPIRTTDWITHLGRREGLKASRLLDISVTTENLKHIRHAITENAVVLFEKN